MSSHVSPTHLRVLAGLLAAPGEESLETIKELAQEHVWLVPSVEQLSQMSLEHWQAEHTRLFVNGHPKTACPPFESVYRHGVMNSHLCDEVDELYHTVGLEVAGEFFPDYLGTLLECAAYVSEHLPVHQDSWETLWQKHLVSWVPRFAEDLQKNSKLKFYQELGNQLKELFQ